jgi:hypothetical protein
MYSARRVRTLAALLSLVIALSIPMAGWAKPCKGTRRLQLRWSQKNLTSLVSLSATVCDTPPSCAAGKTLAEGVTLTKPPFHITITDAAGKVLSGEVDPADPNCGTRCIQLNRAGCTSGTDAYRLPGGFVRYVSSQTGTTLTANKLKIATAEQPKLTAPLSVTVSDANGFSVEMEMKRCRVRESAKSTTINCAG